MISDNYVTGDNIYLRELQNFFFEVLGMMSVTHYGAIGDGRTDCYGPLQVAIDDAKRRNLSFIYVPMGRYIYTGELINMEDITFIGNPHAKIVNIRTCEEIPIEQFGWMNGSYYSKTEADGRFVKIPGDTMTGSLAIGETSTASGDLSFAQGESNTASGKYSHAQGWNNTASGQYSFAGGTNATASGFDSIAYGNYITSGEHIGNTTGNQATGNTSIALGLNTIASGNTAVSLGRRTTASGHRSVAEGDGTIAQGYVQHAQGKYNIAEGTQDSFTSSDLAIIVGNGRADDQRSNAHTLDFGGNGWFAGDVYVGSTSGTNRDSGSRRLATEEYVDNLIAQIQSLNYFQQSIAPISWGTTVTANTEYTETDNYGTWRIYADNSAGSGWGVQNAFDGNDSTGWKCDDISQGNSVNIGMDFPILIKPTEFRVLPGSSTSSPNLWTATIQGKNTDNTWDTLISFELPQTQNPSPLRPQVAVDKWYKGFRVVLTRPDGTSSTQKVIESLEITKGFWKEMT